MNFITGDKFKGIADYTFSSKDKIVDDYDSLVNTLNMTTVKRNAVVYTHTGYVKELFALLKEYPSKYVHVVSHNSDINVDESFELPQNVVKWYTQNVNVEHPRIISIPIGLENDRWFKRLAKKQVMMQLLQQPKQIKNLVYLNHNIATNIKERLNVYQLFENKNFVTSQRGRNGAHFNDYITNVYNHRFVLCPQGNGMDTHRTWETMYMGTIPIEKRNKNNAFYKDFPICFVDEWDEITENFLLCEYERIKAMLFDRNKLEFKYWNNLIRG